MQQNNKNLIVVPEFTMIEDNNSQLSKINIVGKIISEIRVEGYYEEGELIGSDGFYHILFQDGNILTISAFDETIYLSYNDISDVEEFKNETKDYVLTGKLAKKIIGRTVVNSTLCGKSNDFSIENIKSLLNVPSLTIDLDSGFSIGFLAQWDTLYMGLGRKQ